MVDYLLGVQVAVVDHRHKCWEAEFGSTCATKF